MYPSRLHVSDCRRVSQKPKSNTLHDRRHKPSRWSLLHSTPDSRQMGGLDQMRKITYLKMAWIGWPGVLFFGFCLYVQSKIFVCITPNSTLYRYCDVKFAGSPNGILGSLLLLLFAIGWIATWGNILFGER